MPLQIYFTHESDLTEQRANRVVELQPGEYYFLHRYQAVSERSNARVVIAAACAADDTVTEIFEFSPRDLRYVDCQINPSSQFIIASYFLEPYSTLHVESTGPNGTSGILGFVQMTHPSAIPKSL
jgi:hypothetical protein